MSVATELTRIQTAKSNLKTSIEAKGVQIPSNALISAYSGYVDQIQTGGGGISPTFTDASYLCYGGRFVDILELLLPYGVTRKYSAMFMNASASGFTQAKINAFTQWVEDNFEISPQFNMTQLFSNATGDWSNLDFTIDVSNKTPHGTSLGTALYNTFNMQSNATPLRNITLNFRTIKTATTQLNHELNVMGTVRCSGNFTLKGYKTSSTSAFKPIDTFTGGGIIHDMYITAPPLDIERDVTINLKNISMQNITLDSLKRIIGNYTGNTDNITYQVNSTLKSLFDADADAVALAQANNITITS